MTNIKQFMKEVPPYYGHQKETLGLLDQEDRVFDISDPGTGKTRPSVGAFIERRRAGGKKALVLATKSILQSAWGDDIDKFFPGTRYAIAYASNREHAFYEQEYDILITNHDAVRWIVKNVPDKFWDDFDTIIIDESTAFKNHNSQRSKAVYKIAKKFTYRELMTGTPNPNSVTELWHQLKMLDDGHRLGTSFWKFRSVVCEPKQVGPGVNHIKWTDKEGAEFAVYDMIDDITIRHKFEECTDIPKNFITEYRIDLPDKLRRCYDDMVSQAATLLKDGKLLTAVHAASVHQKLMQIASGSVYTNDLLNPDERSVFLDDGRAELVCDLIEERESCLVAFQYRHQRRALEKALDKRKIKYGVIDGTVNDSNRQLAVQQFQSGEIRVIIAHPQSAGHGLTLTKGTTTIWMSPTYNAEHYKQFNHRIYRSGQTRKTETIHIMARNTVDENVYAKLGKKLTSMQLLLDLLEN